MLDAIGGIDGLLTGFKAAYNLVDLASVEGLDN